MSWGVLRCSFQPQGEESSEQMGPLNLWTWREEWIVPQNR